MADHALCRTSINSVPWGTRKQVGIYDIGQSPSNILETEENNITITWRLHETRSKSSVFFSLQKIDTFTDFNEKLLDPVMNKKCTISFETSIQGRVSPPARQAAEIRSMQIHLLRTFILSQQVRYVRF